MAEVNLLDLYPKVKRPVEKRGQLVTDEHRVVALQFGSDYFDGDRMHGYGGYYYDPKFWQATAVRFKDYYNLSGYSKVLDVGCAKGFFLYDLKELIPPVTVLGVDISEYAIAHAHPNIKPFVRIGDARYLEFTDNSYDLVISINTLHNLELDECKHAILEIERVSSGHSFIMVDAWRTEEERNRLLRWNLTAQTYMHVEDWKALFNDIGYSGDYYWFFPD